MQHVRRTRRQGSTFFFTVNTHRGQALLTRAGSVAMLHDSLEEVRRERPLALRAWVILPNHGHFIWTLPSGDDDYRGRWAAIKATFARRLATRLPGLLPGQDKALARRAENIWRRRLLAHRIRDAEDFTSHLDYLHYNPVRHGLAANVRDWRYSSFHTYVERGVYGKYWGGRVVLDDPAWDRQVPRPQSI